MDCFLNRKIFFKTQDEARSVLGDRDNFLHIITENFQCKVVSRGDSIDISGDDESELENVEKIFDSLIQLHRQNVRLTQHEIFYSIKLVQSGRSEKLFELVNETEAVLVTYKGKQIRAKTLSQRQYLSAIAKHAITFGIGAAGTGKTYLAVVAACAALRKKSVEKIILTRPAVEAGERLGFLPGDLQEKVDPYLRPLYDALADIFGVDMYQKFLTRGMIEIAPLAYMRGRTLENSFVILDEAQNTTPLQMKMFLTRLGNNSKMVITGDLTQIDLPHGGKSGLRESIEILKNVRGISIIEFDPSDVMRHPLVERIVEAYEKFERLSK